MTLTFESQGYNIFFLLVVYVGVHEKNGLNTTTVLKCHHLKCLSPITLTNDLVGQSPILFLLVDHVSVFCQNYLPMINSLPDIVIFTQ